MKYINKTLVLSPVYIGFCTSEKDFKKELKKLKVSVAEEVPFLGKHGHATTHIFEHPKDGVICIICMGSTKGRTKAQIYSLLVHEAVHVWQQIKKVMGEKEPSDEFEAYSLQNITQSLFELIDETNK